MKKVNLEIKISKEELRKKLNVRDGKDGADSTVEGPRGERGIKGEAGSPDTGDEIIAKVNGSGGQIDRERIKGIDELEKGLQKKINSIPKGGGGRSSHSVHFYDLSSQTNGILKTFIVPKNISAIVISSDFPSVLMEKNGFTINGNRTQITLLTDNAPSPGSQLLFQYAGIFNTK